MTDDPHAPLPNWCDAVILWTSGLSALAYLLASRSLHQYVAFLIHTLESALRP